MERQKQQHSFAYGFYISDEWRSCRLAYLQQHPICERCGMSAHQVHHKTKLTPNNLQDPEITLNPDNLEALCDTCHQQEHHPRRWRCDELGRVQL